MLRAEHLGPRASDFTVKIYGTDVDEDALATARQAASRTDHLRDVPDDFAERYFTREGQLYRFRRDLRRWCIFGAHNLTQEPPLSHLGLVLCRNVLIYFSSDLQQCVHSRLHYALRDGGVLFLGRSESLLARSRPFRPRHPQWRIFERANGVDTYTSLPPTGSPTATRPRRPTRRGRKGPRRSRRGAPWKRCRWR
jgi:two-component system, chemotaxis family, CheB/CheR fusion protein